jgi:hypothetical protein
MAGTSMIVLAAKTIRDYEHLWLQRSASAAWFLNFSRKFSQPPPLSRGPLEPSCHR